jgi:hypothetical protein
MDVGDKTTLAVMLALRMAGLTVLLPFGDNTRYDLVFGPDVRFSRVQCKTGRFRSGRSSAETRKRPGRLRHRGASAVGPRQWLGGIRTLLMTWIVPFAAAMSVATTRVVRFR